MSGFEVIGVVASILQVVDASVKLTVSIKELYGRVKDAPDRVILHTTQIGQLIHTARMIEQSANLQTPAAHAHLLATLKQAEQLQEILEKLIKDYTQGSSRRKIWKAIVGSEERRLAAGFDRLEKEKSALNLCINFAHAETLSKIHYEVNIMANRSPYAVSVSKDTVWAKRECDTLEGKQIEQAPDSGFESESESNETENSSDTADPIYQQNGDASPISTTSDQSEEMVEVEGHNFNNVKSLGQSAQRNGNDSLGRPTQHSFKNMTSLDHSFQHNGNVDDGGSHDFDNVTSGGTSQQVNGNTGREHGEVVRKRVLKKKRVQVKRMVPKKVPTKRTSSKGSKPAST